MPLNTSDREMEQAFRKAAAELAVEFRAVADELDFHLRNTRIARISGSSFGAAGGVTAFLGVVLTPATFGVSLIATAVGGTVSAVGGVISSGSTLVGFIIKRVKKRDMKKKWNMFQESCRRHIHLPPNMAEGFDDKDKAALVKEILRSAFSAAKAGYSVKSAVDNGKAAATAVKAAKAANAAKLASSTFNNATAAEASAVVGGVVKGVSKATVLLSLISVGASIFDIVQASVDLHKKKKCGVGEQLREVAKQLDELAGN